MRILLARHAPSLGQKDPANYAAYGDSHVPLDPDYQHLSIQCGEFLKAYYQDTQTDKSPLVWTSQFLRAQQTCAGIKDGLGESFSDQDIRLHVDPLLNEQSFGLLPYIDSIQNPIKRKLAKTFADFASKLYQSDAFMNKAPMGQAPAESFNNIRTFISGSFHNDVLEGDSDFLIVSHGAVMKAFVMHWFHLYDRDIWKTLETPNNCDVYEITGEPKNWTIHKIYDGPSGADLRDNPINIIDALPIEKRTVTWDTLAAPSHE